MDPLMYGRQDGGTWTYWNRCDKDMETVDENDRARARCCACGGGQCQSVSVEDLELLHTASAERRLEATVPGQWYPASGTYYVEIPTRNLIPKESWRSVLREYTSEEGGIGEVDLTMNYMLCKRECDWTAYCGPPGAKCEGDRPCPDPVRSGRHGPAKAGSGPHSGTELFAG